MKLAKLSNRIIYIFAFFLFVIFTTGSNIIFADSGCKNYTYGCCGLPPSEYKDCCGGCCDTPSNDCVSLFFDGVQSHSTSTDNSDKISFDCNARLINNPDNILESTNTVKTRVNPGCLHTCGNQDCVASGTPAAKMQACRFLFSNGGSSVNVISNEIATLSDINYNTIKVKPFGTVTFVGNSNNEYRIETIDLEDNAVVNLAPGNYWVEDFKTGKNVIINTTGEGTSRIFIRKKANFGEAAKMNVNSSQVNPSKKLFLYGYQSIQLQRDSVFYGFIYSEGYITLAKNVGLVGAVLGEKVFLEQDATVTYDPDAVADLDTSFLCPPVTHFELVHLNEGIKCFKHSITVKAKKGKNTVTDYEGKIVLDTGTNKGTWLLANGNGAFIDSVEDDGLAEYTFAQSDNGVAEFYLLYAGGVGPATIDVEVYDKEKPDIRDDDKSGTITFNLWGYIITAEKFVSGEDPNAQMYNDVQIAGVPDDMYISAYGQGSGDSVSSCSVRQDYNGSVTLKMWQNYVDPTAGTMTMKINDIPIGTSLETAVDVNVDFFEGSAKVSSVYKDVGKLRFSVKSDESVVPGSTDNFVVKPAKLILTVYDNPQAVDSEGPIFKKAGENFRASVHVLEIGGAITPNFGNEIEPKKVEIYSSRLVAPEGGRNGVNNDGLIGNGAGLEKLSPGIFESSVLTFDEVGIIKLKARIFGQDYLGAGNVESLASNNVGRFIPYVFDATGNTPIFQTSCVSGNFNYIGQPFAYQEQPVVEVTAKSKSNTITKNYFGSFWKLTSSGITQEFLSDAPAPITFDLGDPIVKSNEADVNLRGTGTITYVAGNGIKFNKVEGTNLSPFEAEIMLITNIYDDDNVGYRENPFSFGKKSVDNGIAFSDGKIFYQGRFNIKDSIGIERKTGILSCMTEYYNGVSYIVNTVDNCTPFLSEEHLEIQTQPSDMTTNVAVDPIVNGVCSVKLSPPGVKTGVRQYVIVIPQLQEGYYNLPWLQHDWKYEDSLDNKFDDNPHGKYVFGYRGIEEGIIYTEEPLDEDKE